MSEWLDNAAHWRTVFKAAMALKDSPNPLFAELGQALHAYHVTADQAALADALVNIGERMRGGR